MNDIFTLLCNPKEWFAYLQLPVRVKAFDTANGFYQFIDQDIVTTHHRHHVLEIIIACKGTFTLSAGNRILKGIKVGLVMPNQPHTFSGQGCESEFLCLEPENYHIDLVLDSLGVLNPVEGIYAIDRLAGLKNEAYKRFKRKEPMGGMDTRVVTCIEYIRENIHNADLSLGNLSGQVALSPGRLSHLFKERLGTTIQRYITWSRMKYAVECILQEEMNLTQACLKAGFYDSAHFSKHFRDTFGVRPSFVYNSRIIQDFEDR